MWNSQLLSSLYIISLVQWIGCVELTFDLPDSSRECFHQDIEKNRSATLEFQVYLLLMLVPYVSGIYVLYVMRNA